MPTRCPIFRKQQRRPSIAPGTRCSAISPRFPPQEGISPQSAVDITSIGMNQPWLRELFSRSSRTSNTGHVRDEPSPPSLFVRRKVALSLTNFFVLTNWATILDLAEINVSEGSCSHDGILEVRLDEDSSAENGFAKNGFPEIGFPELSFVKVGSREIGTSKIGISEISYR